MPVGRLALHQQAAAPAALSQRRPFEDVEPQWVEVDLKRIAVNGNGRNVEINEEKSKNVDLSKRNSANGITPGMCANYSDTWATPCNGLPLDWCRPI
jgi:hypothetical protein